METAVAVCAHTAQMAEAARSARVRLDPCDPVQAGLRALAADGDHCDGAEARRRTGLLIAQLACWRAPEPAEALGGAALGGAAEGWCEETRAWVAGMIALQAVEAGEESPLGRVLAAGSVALWHGEPEALSWLAEAIRLSRPLGPA